MGFSLNKSLKGSLIIDDIRFALSSHFIIIILVLSTICRITLHFIVLPNSPSGLGPDEGTYAALAKYVSEGLPVEEFPGYGPSLYNIARSIILPSAFLVQLGMGELSAVRTIATTYGLASSIVLVLCFLALLELRNQKFQISGLTFDRKSLILLLLFTFLPSNFVWSIMGLRESGSQFWIMTTFYLILKLLGSSGKDSLKFTVLCSLALTLAHGTRPETALVFSLVTLLASIVLLLKLRKFLPTIAILFGIFGGQAFTTIPQVEVGESLGAFQILKTIPIQGSTPKSEETLEARKNDAASVACTYNDELIQVEDIKFRCKSYKSYKVTGRNLIKTLKGEISTTQNFEYKRTVNAIGAQSALPANKCEGKSRDIFLLIKCNLSELPYRLFAFLFRPLVFFDQGSTALTFAALENLGWMILIPISVWVSLRKQENTLERVVNLSLISYVILFACASALYEGNLGTAFRHKSTILWPLVLILMIAPRLFQNRKHKLQPSINNKF